MTAESDGSWTSPVDFAAVERARTTLRPHLLPTPALQHPLLSQKLGADVWVKHEHHLPTGAFKVRGGINLLAELAASGKPPPLFTASTGNHGQSIAYACHRFGCDATVVVPVGANEAKVAAIRGLGASVVFHGADFDQARRHAEMIAEGVGEYVHSANEPALVAGVATASLELLEAVPDLQVLVIPIGSGTAAAGACLAAMGLGKSVEIVGVGSSAAPAAFRSWQARQLVEALMETNVEGIEAPRVS
jgi:threonine dehydratase